MAARRKRKKGEARGRTKSRVRRSRASAGYTILTLALVAAAVFLAVTLYGVFAQRPTRADQATVLVLNGCGRSGVGQRTAKLLRSFDLDVIDFRNADNFEYAETIVVDRSGDLDTATSIARRLGVANVIQQIPETPLVDVIVIVGADCEEYLGG
jgi:hypothetical protein